jgi:hypothetical protein
VHSDPNTSTQPSQRNDAERTPTAVGLVRGDVSGLHAPRHAAEIRRYADQLGYSYLCTVRPPHDCADPVFDSYPCVGQHLTPACSARRTRTSRSYARLACPMRIRRGQRTTRRGGRSSGPSSSCT